MDEQNQPNVTVEVTPYSVEDTGIASETKLDQLLTTALTVREELRDRTRKFVIGAIIGAVFFAIVIGAAAGALWGIHNQTRDLQTIAHQNHDIGETIKATADAIQAATSPDAAAKARAATAAAVADIRRSIDCTKLSDEATYPACVEVVARLDEIRAGLDPFSG